MASRLDGGYPAGTKEPDHTGLARCRAFDPMQNRSKQELLQLFTEPVRHL